MVWNYWKYNYVDIPWLFDASGFLGVLYGKIKKTNGIYHGD